VITVAILRRILLCIQGAEKGATYMVVIFFATQKAKQKTSRIAADIA